MLLKYHYHDMTFSYCQSAEYRIVNKHQHEIRNEQVAAVYIPHVNTSIKSNVAL